MDLSQPVNLVDTAFINNKFEWYERIREEAPVCRVKISILNAYALSRYDDCAGLLKNPKVLRNRHTVTGGGRLPFPVPKFMQALMNSMIVEDDPNHRRLRGLVRHAFRPQAVEMLQSRIDDYSHELLDQLPSTGVFDLQLQYALPIPVRMISDMMGVSHQAMPNFQSIMSVLSKGFSGWRLLKAFFWDMPDSMRFVRSLIRTKRDNPGDDILTSLIQAEDGDDRLTEDELVAMVFLLIIAGFETTVHLITNGVHTLLEHPHHIERLRNEPELIDSAVEEILRHRGPVQGTKPNYALEDITLCDVTIPKGQPIISLLAAANHDPRVFDEPQKFAIDRSPNRHLSFGFGNHFCLGAHLARAEARLAIINLINHFPDLRLAVDPSELKLQNLPLWHRYDSLPVSASAAT